MPMLPEEFGLFVYLHRWKGKTVITTTTTKSNNNSTHYMVWQVEALNSNPKSSPPS
jgi:hypothetical protein